MMMPAADPAAAVREIANKLEEKVVESGLDVGNEFVGRLEIIKEQAKVGPGDMMNKVRDTIESLKGKVQAAMDDPASLAASWYGTTVIEKLKALMAEIVALLDKLLQ